MHGIVTFLDNDHYQPVEELWAELKREFSVAGTSGANLYSKFWYCRILSS